MTLQVYLRLSNPPKIWPVYQLMLISNFVLWRGEVSIRRLVHICSIIITCTFERMET